MEAITENSTICNEIEDQIKNNQIYRFASELSHTTENDRKQALKTITNNLQKKPVDPTDNARNKLTKMFSDVDIELLKRPWNKIPDLHKESKITEYVNDKYKDNENKTDILTLLLEVLGKGQLKTIKQVEYDRKQSKITNIPHLIENEDGSFSYTVKQIKKKVTKTVAKSDSKN
jgi:hypothetical protein